MDDNRKERLPCSWRYVNLCLLVPMLNGFINGYCWAGLALHYRDMGWPIARVGTPATCGFIGRVLFQKIQVRYGFWVMIPLGLIHLILTLLGVVFFDQEWAVISEVAALQSLDGAISFEGMTFDAFGRTEDLARQAATTMLSTFIISGALSVPIAGALYDNLGGWQSMSVAHLACQGLLFILVTTEPSLRMSLREFFSKERSAACPDILVNVVPSSPATKLSSHPEEDMRLEDLENLPGQVLTSETSSKENPARPSVRFSIVEPESAPSDLPVQPEIENRTRADSDHSAHKSYQAKDGKTVRSSHKSDQSEGELQRPDRSSFRSGGTNPTGQVLTSCEEKRTPALLSVDLVSGRHSGTSSGRVYHTGRSSRTSSSGRVYNTGESLRTGMSLLETRVARRRSGLSHQTAEEAEAKSIPKDTILLVLMISLCCFNNTVCNIMEVGIFALFFKEYHGWNSAMAIGLAQSAGDLSAAFVMKLLPSGSSDGTSEVGFCRRIFMRPYNLSWLVLFWALCNLAMASPWLVAAVTAQVLMGSLFVYSLKFTTDLSLFYSLGDNGVLLTMQVWCKTAHNAGACFSSVLGPLIYLEVSPVAPFLVAGSVSATTFVVFSAFFAFRVGLLNMESAEEQRARHKGIKRVSAWRQQIPNPSVIEPGLS